MRRRKIRGNRTLLSGVDELSSVHALSGNEGLLVRFVLVGVAEHNLGEGGTTSGVVDDLTNHTTEVSRSLSIIQRAELRGTDTVVGVGLDKFNRRIKEISSNENEP